MAAINVQWSKLSLLRKEDIEKIEFNKAGIYRLSYKAEDNQIFVFFVGHAVDLKEKLLSHLSEKESNVCVKNYIVISTTYFRYAELLDEKQRVSAECFLINFYQPSCNALMADRENTITLNIS